VHVECPALNKKRTAMAPIASDNSGEKNAILNLKKDD